MPSSGAGPAELSPTDALVLLVTIETLLFAALGIVLTLNETRGRVPDLPLRPRQLGFAATGVVTAVALGALVAWANLFTSPWPHNFTRGAEAAATLVGIVVQPLASWVIAMGLKSKT